MLAAAMEVRTALPGLRWLQQWNAFCSATCGRLAGLHCTHWCTAHALITLPCFPLVPPAGYDYGSAGYGGSYGGYDDRLVDAS